jgi:hypothetical protein
VRPCVLTRAACLSDPRAEMERKAKEHLEDQRAREAERMRIADEVCTHLNPKP